MIAACENTKTTELYTLNWRILSHVNYISIKLSKMFIKGGDYKREAEAIFFHLIGLFCILCVMMVTSLSTCFKIHKIVQLRKCQFYYMIIKKNKI